MKTFLILSNITKTFETENGIFTALDNVSLSLEQGTTTIIGGANGSGKSVLMSIIAGLQEPSSGTIKIENCDPKNRIASIGLVFQDADTQILGETPREDIAFGPQNLGLKKKEIAERVQNALIQSGLEKKADYPSRFLSGGQKRRLTVAGILAMEKEAVIFDEPYANLDYTGVKQVNALIKELQEKHKTIIILSHELEKCLALASHFIVLHNGVKTFDGTPQEALKENLEQWGIRNPLVQYNSWEQLKWI